jgi:bifunctional non-homologous end joining protein LigD
VRAEIPTRIPFQIVASSTEPPDSRDWLHEVKHDGHRLLAIVADDALRLISRNGHDRTQLFSAPFEQLLAAGLLAMVLDGEIAVPDERGITHIDALTEAMRLRRAESFAYFAFDLLFLDGHDLRGCAIEDRKALLRDIIGRPAPRASLRSITSPVMVPRSLRPHARLAPRASSQSAPAALIAAALDATGSRQRSARRAPL